MPNKSCLVYEYMLLYLAYDYVLNKLNNENIHNEILPIFNILNQFNAQNNFSKSKRQLLPFLITIGNGKKFELLRTFYPFVITKEGFVSQNIEEDSNKSNIFIFEDDILLIKPDFINLVKNIDFKMPVNTQSFVEVKQYYFNLIAEQIKIIYKDVTSDGSFNKIIENEFNDIQISINNINKKITKFASEKLDDIIYWSQYDGVYDLNKNDFLDEEGSNLLNISKDIILDLNIKILENDFDLQNRRASNYEDYTDIKFIETTAKFRKEITNLQSRST